MDKPVPQLLCVHLQNETGVRILPFYLSRTTTPSYTSELLVWCSVGGVGTVSPVIHSVLRRHGSEVPVPTHPVPGGEW